MGILTDDPIMGVLSGEDSIEAAVKRERAACARIARDEAAAMRARKEQFNAITDFKVTVRAEYETAAASAERIARAILRGER